MKDQKKGGLNKKHQEPGRSQQPNKQQPGKERDKF